MINRGKMPRQLRNKGGITNVMPRKKYGIGSDLKDFVRKVIPNELADVAVKAAPFVAPFNPAVAGLMRGIGRFDQRGSLSDAFKQGIATAGFGAGARALGGAPDIFGGGIRGGFTSPLSEGRTTAVKNLFDPKKTSTFDAVAEDELAGDKILTEATKGTGTGVKTPGIGPIEKLRQQIPIINKLDPIVGQQLIVGGATSAASLIYDSFVNDYREHDPETESYDEYLARRKEVVGRQMRQYFDNYFKFDKEYSALDDAGKDAFVARYNVKDGGMMPTGIMKTNKAGVIERDYRDKGGFVPVGIKEKADDVPAMLSKNEFVFTADAVRGAGNGSIEKGAQKMYDTMKRLEKRVV
jgi:hypothetical protein